MRDGKGMEKIDRILTEQIQSGRRYSVDFYEFVEDRNKDVGLFDDFIKTGKKGVEVYKVESLSDILGIQDSFYCMILIFIPLLFGSWDMWKIGMILLIPTVVYTVMTMVRLAVSTMPFLGFKYVCKTLDKKVTLLYIQSGLLDYKAYKEYHESANKKSTKR